MPSTASRVVAAGDGCATALAPGAARLPVTGQSFGSTDVAISLNVPPATA
jgi:hypothetical protein